MRALICWKFSAQRPSGLKSTIPCSSIAAASGSTLLTRRSLPGRRILFVSSWYALANNPMRSCIPPSGCLAVPRPGTIAPEAVKAVPALITLQARPGSIIEAPQQLAQELVTVAPGIVGIVIERVGGRYGRVVAGQEYLTDVVLGRRFRVSTDSFFQVNIVQTMLLVERALTMLEPQRTDVVLYGYSGVGLFSAFLAARAARVIAVESQPSAVMDARANATLNNQSNITTLEGTLERLLGQLHYRRERIDLALVDPPRAGCHPKALQALQALGPRAICYVSCDPSTLARDVAALCSGGRYRLVAAQPIDMTPQTYHIECIALLTRIGAR